MNKAPKIEPLQKEVVVEIDKEFPLFIRKSITHKGIKVAYEIDYLNNTISLVENHGQKKEWLFAGRSLSYIPSWINILEAMKKAMEQAEKELREYVDYNQRNDLKRTVEIYQAINKE